MRTIKFRAWVVDKKEMQVAGSLDFWFRAVAETGINPWGKSIFMQYTGLKDKNGKEIYEGDIGEHTYYPGEEEMGTTTEKEVVAFAGGQFGLKRGDDVIGFWETMDTEDDFEIIGNIYENKDLLKGGEK